MTSSTTYPNATTAAKAERGFAAVYRCDYNGKVAVGDFDALPWSPTPWREITDRELQTLADQSL